MCDLLCGQTIRFGFPHFNGSIRVLFRMQFSEEKNMPEHESRTHATIFSNLVFLLKNNILNHTPFVQDVKNHSKMFYAEKVSCTRGRTTKKLFPGHVKIKDDLSNFLLSDFF